MSEADRVTSIRQAAAACNVTPSVVRRWRLLGLIPEPPWTLEQLHQVRELRDTQGRRRGRQVAHGARTRWNEGYSSTRCRQANTNDARARGRAKAQALRRSISEEHPDWDDYRAAMIKQRHHDPAVMPATSASTSSMTGSSATGRSSVATSRSSTCPRAVADLDAAFIEQQVALFGKKNTLIKVSGVRDSRTVMLSGKANINDVIDALPELLRAWQDNPPPWRSPQPGIESASPIMPRAQLEPGDDHPFPVTAPTLPARLTHAWVAAAAGGGLH